MTEPSLEQYQNLFTEHLLSEEFSFEGSEQLLGHLLPMFEQSNQHIEAEDRFAIYRNNVILSLSTAVADTFPVIKRLIGDGCFKSAAIAFVRKHPPEQPSLLFYGEEFISFIKTFPSCQELAYLSDVARLEWLYIRAFHADDAELFDPQSLGEIPPELLGDIAFQIHPSVQLMQSDWPVDTIWEANLQQQVATIDLDNHSGCNLLLYRQDFQVQVLNLTTECYNFLQALVDGESINHAWSITVEQQKLEKRPEVDEQELSGILGYLLGLSIFSSLIRPETLNAT